MHLYYLYILIDLEMLTKYSFWSLFGLVKSCKSTFLSSPNLPCHSFSFFVVVFSFLYPYFRKKSTDQKSTTRHSRCCAREEEVNTHESCKCSTEGSHTQCCLSATVQGQGDSLTGTEELQETRVTCSLAER